MKYALMTLSLIAALSFAACGQSGGNPVANVPAPGVGATGPYTNPINCQIGQVYTTSNGCLNRNSCQYGYGWLPGTGQCVAGTPITEQSVYGTAYTTRFFGTMSISNPQQFSLLLKYANLCDPYWVGWNFGSWNCDTWVNRGGFIELRTFAGTTNSTTSVNMFIGAGSSYSANWMYSYQISNSSQYIGFSQQASVVDYNNSTGMQIVGTSAGQDVGLRLIVPTGHLTDQTLQAQLQFQGSVIATVTLSRY